MTDISFAELLIPLDADETAGAKARAAAAKSTGRGPGKTEAIVGQFTASGAEAMGLPVKVLADFWGATDEKPFNPSQFVQGFNQWARKHAANVKAVRQVGVEDRIDLVTFTWPPEDPNKPKRTRKTKAQLAAERAEAAEAAEA